MESSTDTILWMRGAGQSLTETSSVTRNHFGVFSLCNPLKDITKICFVASETLLKRIDAHHRRALVSRQGNNGLGSAMITAGASYSASN